MADKRKPIKPQTRSKKPQKKSVKQNTLTSKTVANKPKTLPSGNPDGKSGGKKSRVQVAKRPRDGFPLAGIGASAGGLEGWFGGVVETAMDAIITIDEQQQIVLFNHAAEQMFRCSSSDVMGTSIDHFIPARFRKAHQGHIQRFSQSGGTARAMGELGTLFALRADGEEFPMEASISQLEADGKKLMTVILRDISERVEATQALERSERGQYSLAQMNSAILNSLPAHIAMVDSRGVILSVNEAWKRFATMNVFERTDFGIGANYIRVCEEARGDCAYEAKIVAKGLRAVLAGNRDAFALEYPCHAPNEQRWFRVMITPLSQEGKAGAVIMHLNVTERRLAEEALKDSQRTFSTLLKNLPGIAYRSRNDRDWTMEFISEGALALTGYQANNFLENHKISYGQQVIHPDDRKRVWEETQSAVKKTQPFQYTYRIKTADGKLKWVWEQGQAIYSSQGKAVALEGFITDITKQKQTEESIQASEERLELALVGARLGVWDWNIQTGEVHFSDQWAKMLGYSQDQIEPAVQAWEKMMHPDDKPGVMKILQDHLDGHTPFYQTEHRLRSKSGKWKWVLDTGKVVSRDANGAPLRATGIHQDINERKEIEHDLLQERGFIDAVLETAGALVVVIDRQGRIVRFNRSCEELTGHSSQDVIGRSIWELNLVPSHELPDVKKVFQKLRAGQSPSHFENHWVSKDQGERLIAWANTILTNEKGQAEYVIGTGVDITNRKEMESALRESQDRFQAFMNHSPTIAFLKDRLGKYVYVNQPFEQKFGHPRAECVGKTDHQLFPPEVAQMFKETDHQTLTKGKVLETEETMLDARGKHRHWVVLKFPVHDAQGDKLVGGIALDITLRKEAEDAVKEQKFEIQRSQEELQALGKRLVTAQEEERRRISRELHDDMNQRLAVLAVTIQSTQQSFAEPDPLHATLQQLYDEVSSISDDIRRLAYQLHPSVLDDLGLKIALQSFVQDFIQWAHIPATFQAQDVPVSIPQDIAACVYRLTQESLRNVARHAGASQVAVVLAGHKGGLRLSIIDNGKGFDPETVRDDRRGLGLIGMQERVSYVKGTFTIHAVPGNGTEIVVWVPLPTGDA